VIPFSRRLETARGGFGGVVVVELDSTFFASFYAGAGLAPNSALILTRSDGPVLARYPSNEVAAGKSFSRSGVWAVLGRQDSGNYEAASAVDGIPRIYGFRNSSEFPIFSVVGFPKDSVFAGWRRRTQMAIAGLLAFTAATLGGTAFLLIQLRRRLASEAKFRAIFDSAVDGIVTTSSDGVVQSLNGAAEAMFGWREAELAGRHVSVVFPNIGPATANLREAGAAQGEVTARRRDGSQLPVSIAVARWTGDGQSFVTGIVRDITERTRLETELRGAKVQAEEANRAKSEFLANMSHELRTPLNAVIGFADVLKNQMFGALDPRYADYARDIHSSGQHLLNLINDVLDLSKAEAGHLALRDELVDVAEMIDTCRRLVAAQAAARAIAIETTVAPGAEFIRADDTRLRQVVLNLVSNAVKFTPDGGRVAIDAFDDGRGAMVLRVSDTGIGIAGEDVAKVLAPFGQVESALSRTVPGTGLGLPLTKHLVELHGGSLAIESELGKGTVVTVRLPARSTLRQVA
jgi:PAS domain S-box-containing protein